MHRVQDPPPAIVVMGVAGSGKTTVGAALAAALGVALLDADDLHTPEAVGRMRAGLPLRDADREPWIERLRDRLSARSGVVVLACSALRRAHRDRLRVDASVRFLFLRVERDELARRLRGRVGHFAGPDLLDGQLEALEAPTGDEALTLDGEAPVARLVERALAWIR